MKPRHQKILPYRFIIILSAYLATAGTVLADEFAKPDKPADISERRIGLYLHACWPYEYPFSLRTWRRADYDAMFQLLECMGYNTVMIWPTLEAVPAPISKIDREKLGEYRSIIGDAKKRGLEIWLTQCAALTSKPEAASIPWERRNLYAGLSQTVRLDDPSSARAYFHHRAKIMEILNNADGYVTIDGDPGGYPGAKQTDFLEVFLHDRRVIDRVGTHPQEQKLIPWIWCGWGTNGVWSEPIAPFVAASLKMLRKGMPEPWELLPGRSREGHANGRINLELASKAGLIRQSTLFLYEAVEYEPSVPAATLQFDEIRASMKKEYIESAGARGWFGNVQSPIMVLPNVYFFARAAQDSDYLDQTDEKVLADFAAFLGGPPELLVPAWECLRLGLDDFPEDLPDKLRRIELSGQAATSIPGGPSRYFDIIARQVESRIRLLRACSATPKNEMQATAAVVEGTSALVDWWKTHRYVHEGDGNAPFRWRFVHRSQYMLFKAWCAANISNPRFTAESAAAEIDKRAILPLSVAKRRMDELLGVK